MNPEAESSLKDPDQEEDQGFLTKVKSYANFECIGCYHDVLIKANDEFYDKVHVLDEENSRKGKCCYAYPLTNVIFLWVLIFGLNYLYNEFTSHF